MATISDNESIFTVVVTFQTTPATQQEATDKIWDYIETFLSKQPGCISSSLHKSFDGKNLINYAQWETADHFKAFSEKARGHPDLPALLEYKPSPQFHSVYKTVSASD